jgi:hypothetical protein
MVNGTLSGIEYAIDRPEGMSCLICHATDRSLLSRRGDTAVGICEPCALAVQWAWRRQSGEIPSGATDDDLRKVSVVYVLVVRRKEVRRLDASEDDEDKVVPSPAELNSSWEFLLVPEADGTCRPPSVTVDQETDLRDQPRAAMVALSAVGLSSWPALAEPLFTAFTPRGRLAGVVLVRGWAERPMAGTERPRLAWRSWPLSAHTGPMAGFWRTLETVWGLRLHKHCVVEGSGELCVRMREAACRYIELQSALGSGVTTDSSMSAVYRAGMDVDELAVERMLRIADERQRNVRALAVIPSGGTGNRRYPGTEGPPGTGSGEEDGSSWATVAADGDDQSVEDVGGYGEGDGDDGGTGDSGDGPDPEEDDDPSFVRPRRPLRK